MTAVESREETRLLDWYEDRVRRTGYRLVRAPSPDQLPEFLQDLPVDAIAEGRSPSVVVEVATSPTSRSLQRIDLIRERLIGRPDWVLEVLYTRSNPEMTEVDPGDISHAAERARRLSGQDPAAALLVAWSALEAAARRSDPSAFNKPTGSFELVDHLVSMGDLSQEQGLRFVRLARLRNAVSHGQLDLPIPLDQLTEVIDTVERLSHEDTGPTPLD